MLICCCSGLLSDLQPLGLAKYAQMEHIDVAAPAYFARNSTAAAADAGCIVLPDIGSAVRTDAVLRYKYAVSEPNSSDSWPHVRGSDN